MVDRHEYRFFDSPNPFGLLDLLQAKSSYGRFVFLLFFFPVIFSAPDRRIYAMPSKSSISDVWRAKPSCELGADIIQFQSGSDRETLDPQALAVPQIERSSRPSLWQYAALQLSRSIA